MEFVLNTPTPLPLKDLTFVNSQVSIAVFMFSENPNNMHQYLSSALNNLPFNSPLIEKFLALVCFGPSTGTSCLALLDMAALKGLTALAALAGPVYLDSSFSPGSPNNPD